MILSIIWDVIISMSEETPLEVQSYINFVRFYERELRRILGGELVEDVLEVSDRTKLRNHGVLVYRQGDWFLTDKAKEILQKH